MRKLASVRRIADIRPIEGADKIEVCVVDGWECVVKKDEGFKIGDLIVYIEVDSILPERKEFEFLRDRKFRVHTIKLRKQISQGLVLPLSILPNKSYREGDDVTNVLNIKKYDPQAEREKAMLEKNTMKTKNIVIKFLLRFKWFRKMYIKPRKGGFPSWIVKTDEERIQNKVKMFEIERDLRTEFCATEKLDGQSATYYIKRYGKKLEFGVCSRNIKLSKADNSSYWTIARQYNIENVLKNIIDDADSVVLQGEIIGEGIQGNKYKISGYDFYAFNLIINGKKQDQSIMDILLKQQGIKSVPVIYDHIALKETIPETVSYAKGNSVLLPSQKREGLVFRNYDRNISFKVINPEFLLAEK